MKDETEFQIDDRCLYIDGGDTFECRITFRTVENGWLNLGFEVLKVLQRTYYDILKVGSTFSAAKRPNHDSWHIEEVQQETVWIN